MSENRLRQLRVARRRRNRQDRENENRAEYISNPRDASDKFREAGQQVLQRRSVDAVLECGSGMGCVLVRRFSHGEMIGMSFRLASVLRCRGVATVRVIIPAALLFAGIGGTPPAHGQALVGNQVGNTVGSSSFFESTGVAWSLRGPGFHAQFGGGPPLLPPFGPPLNASSVGVGFGGGGVSGGLRLFGGQSSSSSLVGTSASVTTLDGAPGQIQSGAVRPFVTGFTPIVGNYPVQPNDGIAASRQTVLQSIAESKAAAQNVKLQRYLRRAERADSEGNLRMARANYRLALPLASPPLRAEIIRRLRN